MIVSGEDGTEKGISMSRMIAVKLSDVEYGYLTRDGRMPGDSVRGLIAKEMRKKSMMVLSQKNPKNKKGVVSHG